MNSFLKNNALSLMLLTGVIIGGALGLLFGDGVLFLRPFGQIFLNLIFVLVVPLVFFSIASSITGLQRSHVIGKVLLCSLLVFGWMSVISGLLAGLAGLVFLMHKPAANASIAMRSEMDAIAASIIGGTLLTGGVGNVIGTFFGVMILATIQKIIALSPLNASWWQDMASGAMLGFFIILQSVVLANRAKKAQK